MADTPNPDIQSKADSSDSSDHDEPSMVVSRARRSNFGNKLSQLLAQEEVGDAEDEYGEVFQEIADDREFGGADAEDQGDVSLESSSDEEEDEEGDEEAGEKDFKKEERAINAKKRKARPGLLQQSAALRKKVKLAPSKTGPTAAEVRPRKKSERVSWLPTQEEGPVRQSSRRATVANKEDLHERLREKEKHRLSTVATMQAAEKRKQEGKPKVMTQAERLAEAAKVEQQNSKSLDRWEEAEKKRAEEREARLEALKSRKLEGPVIRYWSRPSIYMDGKHMGTGKDSVQRIKAEYADKVSTVTDEESAAPANVAPKPPDHPSTNSDGVHAQLTSHPASAPDTHPAAYPNSIIFAPPQGPASFLDGIHYYASLPSQLKQQQTLLQPVPAPPTTHPPPPDPPLSPPPHHTVELAVRNLLQLQHFDELRPRPNPHSTESKVKDREALSRILFAWHKTLSTKTPPKTLCAITGQPAHYRDPMTGLPYHDAYAFKCIRRLVAGAAQWSGLLGCYVGPVYEAPVGRPAVGVPERFAGAGREVVKREEGGGVEVG